ncbi:hypothetical protein [Cognatiyoonia sp. IB215182]|uniref:hypothetical protein n=1 Tax=Cognatiyoonia sp. IB215182 TaxID=3097353 RepID=UPI002A129ECB|nr:hypothetical protein [Cognatiyoonia sp. IB215182]MDX8354351.1 hypothetical protein [Cognatiyoonia sp. IB215182]
MAPLTKGRNTPQRLGDIQSGPVPAGAVIFQGALLVRTPSGYVQPGVPAVGLVGVGRAEEAVDNTGGEFGDLTVRYRPGVFRYANSAGDDAVVLRDIGTLCFVVDDQTVAATNGAGARSPAGVIADVDAQGVWVRLDEALTNAS